MTDASTVHAQVEDVLGRKIDGVGLSDGDLAAVSLLDGEKLTSDDRDTLSERFGNRFDDDY